MGGLEPRDIGKLVLVSDPHINRSTRDIAFTATRINLDKDRYESSIWLVDLSGEAKGFTRGVNDRCPRWSPDSRLLSFISKRESDEKPGIAELWLMKPGSAEPWKLLVAEGGIRHYEWSPDSRKILFISRVGGGEKEDVRIIDDVPVWFNGEGWIHGTRRHLFIVDVPSGIVEQVTSGDQEVLYASWSPDSRKIAMVVSVDRLKPFLTNIEILDLETGERKTLLEKPMVIRDLAWSPEGGRLVFRGHAMPRGLSSHLKLWLIGEDGGEPERISVIDLDINNMANSDARGPSCARSLIWSPDGYIYYPVAAGGEVHLYRVKPHEEPEKLVEGGVVDDFDASESLVAYTYMRADEPPELYALDPGEGPVKLTGFNEYFLSKAKLKRPEKFSFTATDGVAVEGWVLRSKACSAQNPCPAVLEIHGGPATQYGEGFMFEFHLLASNGFAVIYVNPRGSDGYSEEFRDIRGRYGDRDYQDLMEALDYVLSQSDFIDPRRIGVAGGSYGGFMTNWIIGHTNRFKAAVTQRSISNWTSFYGTTDIGWYFAEDQLATTPWRSHEEYWFRSPLRYVDGVETPLLIIHSLEDYRCWLDQALQLYTALKIRGKKVRLALFPGENHDLSRSGKPKHRVERLKLILEWFEEHLKG